METSPRPTTTSPAAVRDDNDMSIKIQSTVWRPLFSTAATSVSSCFASSSRTSESMAAVESSAGGDGIVVASLSASLLLEPGRAVRTPPTRHLPSRRISVLLRRARNIKHLQPAEMRPSGSGGRRPALGQRTPRWCTARPASSSSFNVPASRQSTFAMPPTLSLAVSGRWRRSATGESSSGVAPTCFEQFRS